MLYLFSSVVASRIRFGQNSQQLFQLKIVLSSQLSWRFWTNHFPQWPLITLDYDLVAKHADIEIIDQFEWGFDQSVPVFIDLWPIWKPRVRMKVQNAIDSGIVFDEVQDEHGRKALENLGLLNYFKVSTFQC